MLMFLFMEMFLPAAHDHQRRVLELLFKLFMALCVSQHFHLILVEVNSLVFCSFGFKLSD